MDVQIKRCLFCVFFLVIICLAIFHNPLFSSKPLGLDALGHLSKVSYLKAFPFADWDMSWYSGTLFLKLYAPLFYYLVAIFPNSIFGVNFLSFLSILFCSIGIFLYVNYLTKDSIASLFSGLGFLSVLSISFYYVGVGNHPWVASLWALPFSLYFLEKALKEKNKTYFILYSIFFSIGILMHVLVGFLIGVSMVLRILIDGVSIVNLKKVFFFGIIPVLISSFWFFPFLINGNNFSGGYSGVVPSVLQLFGFDESPVGWAAQVGGIGVLIYFSLLSVIIFFIKFKKDRKILFLFFMSALMFFLLFGGLRSHYPYGVSAVRFILPLSIFLSLFVGVVFGKAKIFRDKNMIYLFFLFLLIGLFWNCVVVNENYEKYSYNDDTSRYNIFMDISEELPIENNFTNYRFGTSHFVFGETINYFYPRVSQTFGYQDAGMLDASCYYDMRWNIWASENITDSIYWLDWFGINYFEVAVSENPNKFLNDSRFLESFSYFGKGYDFYLFEYLDAKQIISLVDSLENSTLGDEKEFSWERNHPDKAVIKYDSVDSDDVVIFKEFFHKSWAARDLVSGKALEIEEVGPGFMAVYPGISSNGVEFYQVKTIEEYVGYLLTLIGIIWLLGFCLIKKYHN